eukprot:SAG22_NODE_421_length_10720_cov_22.582619_4_plen_80_part_00
MLGALAGLPPNLPLYPKSSATIITMLARGGAPRAAWAAAAAAAAAARSRANAHMARRPGARPGLAGSRQGSTYSCTAYS